MSADGAVQLLGFCSACGVCFHTAPGWGDGGEGMLSAICGSTTNTHTRANGNPQQNKQHAEGAGLAGSLAGGQWGEVRGHLLGGGGLGAWGSGEAWSPWAAR